MIAIVEAYTRLLDLFSVERETSILSQHSRYTPHTNTQAQTKFESFSLSCNFLFMFTPFSSQLGSLLQTARPSLHSLLLDTLSTAKKVSVRNRGIFDDRRNHGLDT